MIKKIGILLLSALWIIMLIKTILAAQLHDLSPTYHYYGGMLENTWQGHFNLDLLIHSILFACWIVYREKSRVVGILCGLATIYFGAVFSLLYLIVILIRSKDDTDVLFRGEKVIVS